MLQFSRIYQYLDTIIRITGSLQVSRSFGPYVTDMRWAEPDFGAAVYAFRHLFSFRNHYQAVAASARIDAAALLSPQHTGDKMKQRLNLLHECLCLVGRVKHKKHCSEVTTKWSAVSRTESESDDLRRYVTYCREEVLGTRMADFPPTQGQSSSWMKSVFRDTGRDYHLRMDIPVAVPPHT